MSLYKLKKYLIKDVIKQTNDNTMIRIQTNLNPIPGQFVQVSIPGIGEAPISSASYNKKELDLNFRVVGSVTEALNKFKKGDKVYLRGPYGNGYPMEKFKGQNLILVGGGCGVAPLRGIIEYIDKHREDYKHVELFFGFRTPSDVLFKNEVLEWSKRYNLNLSVDKAPEENLFHCPVGFVTQILERVNISNENSSVLMCGPPIMIDKSIEIIKQKGFTDEQIWVSLERHMKCCTGKCGHCMINGKYVCSDGPVFRYDEVKSIDE
ncbi:FAD/NAD(P)-binding protein [archaeon]|nr:FAD/NAD(P)-binding protein [archaeon]MBL7056885.1 FAD/NAD(P)-binding protein [Candidatus Woesearchaeota archaeon]